MSLPVEIETLLVARDAALEGRDAVAADLRAMVEVEFERTRHTASARIQRFEGRVERANRRTGDTVGSIAWREYLRWLDDPTACLRRPMPLYTYEWGDSIDSFEAAPPARASSGLRAGDMLAMCADGGVQPARVVDVSENRITLGRSTPIADLLAYGAEQILKPPVYRPPAVSREVYDEMRRRGLIREPRERQPSKAERRLARRSKR